MADTHTNTASETSGFDRSHGFVPWNDLSNVVVAFNGLFRAMVVSWNQYCADVHVNAPKTEQELLRWHASLLTTCLDVVNEQLRAAERTAAENAAPPPPARSEPQTIDIK
ncbi:MAG: hypothetical protein GVY13_15770 [Alphaproteobacteria bacterium]|jgi:hypothetical protein|nr:hypothetical protein [Alphaproteobacteria bacterium]